MKQEQKNYFLLNYFLLKNQQNLEKNFSPNDTELALKQALKILVEYHVHKKKILFVGFPKIKNQHRQRLLENTGHVFLPNNVWLNGVFLNSKALEIYVDRVLKKKKLKNELFFKDLKNLIVTKNQLDLIVIFQVGKNDKIVKELTSLKLPVIIFSPFVSSDWDFAYQVFVDLQEKNLKKLIVFLIYSILKKKIKKSPKFIVNKFSSIKFWKLKIFLYKRLKYKKKIFSTSFQSAAFFKI
uniref:Ribosomal protein S2 n=1 Tax=Toxarium undulatum TaxID=210620 RepID=A0A2U9GI20_9STRA|nr:ribosomal protein S2 [Toxarium undulatum]AWQ64116.1 ribosomal protein S2 [Toxarium undulatum]